MRETIQLAADVQPTTLNDAARVVDVCYYSGAAVRRIDPMTGEEYLLTLSPNPDLSILNSGGGAVRDSHMPAPAASQVGVVLRAWSEGTRQLATLQFSPQDYATPLWENIKAKIVQKLSAGLFITEKQDTTPTGATTREFTATKWTPFEISVVPTPADLGTQFLSRQTETSTARASARKETTMSDLTNTGGQKSAITLERQERASTLDALTITGIKLGVEKDFFKPFYDNNVPMDVIRTQMLDHVAVLGEQNMRGERTIIDGNISITRDGGDGMVQAMSDALILRGNPRAQVCDRAREYATMTMVDMARTCLQLRGASIPGSREKIIELAAMSTSDFPSLLQSTGERTLRQAYDSAPSGILTVAKMSTARDFRPVSRLMLGEAPALQKINENGEFHNGAMSESAAAYSLNTFGRIVSLSRKSIINDDLQAFTSLSAQMGTAAKEFMCGELVRLLVSNPQMSDKLPVFDPGHLNYNTKNALALTGLTAARKAMRLQTGLSGTAINATPKFLLCPAELETVAEQLLTQLAATQWTDANPFADGRLTLAIEPRLDATSGSTWYLTCDPAVIDTIEYASLEGQPGPQVTSKWGFEVDAFQMRISLDFGCGIIDFRGLSRNDQ